MSLYKKYRKLEKWVSRQIPHQHESERRKINQAAAAEIGYYQEQKEQMAADRKRLETEKSDEKRRLAKKQIRGLRTAFRAPGFMESASSGYGEKLGE